MNRSTVDISVVIVNYKVKEYIANLLHSIKKAKYDLELEIFVVDNNSEDGSVTFLRERFPEVNYIENTVNVGFGKANNQAIHQASGEYILIINPDTLVSEDTFTVLIEHMQHNPECGVAGCKILNPDGSFAPESRRSVPTIWSSFAKVIGLSSLNPDSKLFGQYYLSWLDENEQAEIPVLSGSFMFWRAELLKSLGGFDQRFFMYGEDIDLCYRVQDTDYHIDYVPDTSIIHYKGESSRKQDFRYIRIFNKALYQFFEKHYSSKYSFLFRIFIFSVIWLRAGLSLIANNLRLIGAIASELVLLNVSVIFGFLIRFKFSYEVLTNIQNLKFLWINLLASMIYIFSGSMLGLYRKNKDSISNQIKAVIISYSGVAIITFFVRDYAFSRLALIIGGAAGIVLMLLFNLIQINLWSSDSKVTGKLKRIKVLLVGNSGQAEAIKARIHARPNLNYEVIGVISVSDQEKNGEIGSLPQLRDLIKAYRVDQVFFALDSISYKDMLRQISLLQNENVVFKLVTDSMDFILGKSNVEYLETMPLVEVDFGYSNGLNRFTKRLLDICVSLPLLLLLTMLTWPSLLFSKSRKSTVKGATFYEPASDHRWKNRTMCFWNILKGSMSLVGSPLYEVKNVEFQSKPGLSGLIQMNETRIQSASDAENYEFYYLQNYSVWTDIDILLKSVFNGIDLSKDLEKTV